MAASNGYLEVLEFLAEHKADLNARDNEGWTPLHAAVCWNQVKKIVVEIAVHRFCFGTATCYFEIGKIWSRRHCTQHSR